MDKKIIAILKKVYFNDNQFYNSDLDRFENRIPDSISKTDIDLLVTSGFPVNNFETFEHDSSMNRFLALKNNGKLTLNFSKNMFLKGLTGEFIRGRQTLISYLYLKNLSKHKFEGNKTCEICGLPRKQTIDKTLELYSYHLGSVWNEIPIHFLIELEEILNYDNPIITENDNRKLKDLLSLIENAEPNETPSRLEKRIAKSKILPRTSKYTRYGILQTLSECGILPNKFINPMFDEFYTRRALWEASKNLKTSHRSDIVLPLGGWKGENGINYNRYKEIFEQSS